VRAETPKRASGHPIYDVLGLAVLTLIILKLTGVVTWSWWWVLTPLWINIALLPLVAGGWILSARHGIYSPEGPRHQYSDE